MFETLQERVVEDFLSHVCVQYPASIVVIIQMQRTMEQENLMIQHKREIIFTMSPHKICPVISILSTAESSKKSPSMFHTVISM